MKKLMCLIVFNLLIQASNATTVLPSGAVNGPQVIGGAYNSDLNFFEQGMRCVEVDEWKDVERVYNNRGRVDYNENNSENSLTKEFGWGLGFDLQAPTGDSFGFNRDFLNSFVESSFSTVGFYQTKVFVGSEILKGPLRLTEEAMRLSQENPEMFDKICGNEFVTKIDKGGIGKVMLKIESDEVSSSEESSMDFSLGLLDMGNFNGGLHRLSQNEDLNIKISVTGTQEGGSPARINSIFGTGNGITSCVLADIDGCKKLLSSVVKYFSKDFVKQFDSYYRGDLGSGVIELPVTATPLKYVTSSYCKLNPEYRPFHLNCNDKIDNSPEFEFLENKKKEFLGEVKRIEELGKNLKLVLAPDYFSLVNMYLDRMEKNLKSIQETLVRCKSDEWTCKNEVSQQSARFYPSQPEILDFIQNDERIQFCFSSGRNVDISGLEIRTKTGSEKHKSFKIIGAPKGKGKTCYKFNAPELNNEDFDGLEIRIRTRGENLTKCKMHITKKFSSWAEWDLKKVTVKHFKSGYKKTFEGTYLKKRMKCKKDKKSRYLLDWNDLTFLK